MDKHHLAINSKYGQNISYLTKAFYCSDLIHFFTLYGQNLHQCLLLKVSGSEVRTQLGILYFFSRPTAPVDLEKKYRIPSGGHQRSYPLTFRLQSIIRSQAAHLGLIRPNTSAKQSTSPNNNVNVNTCKCPQ